MLHGQTKAATKQAFLVFDSDLTAFQEVIYLVETFSCKFTLQRRDHRKRAQIYTVHDNAVN